jgi:hypothetical protein
MRRAKCQENPHRELLTRQSRETSFRIPEYLLKLDLLACVQTFGLFNRAFPSQLVLV